MGRDCRNYRRTLDFLSVIGLTPSLLNIPADEYISELVGHIFWFWAIEMIRRDLRNRITHEPDAEVPLDAPFR